jgi:hypothetical protein
MNSKVVAASVELKKVYNILAEDVEEARTYGQKISSGFAHRSLFRATFALIEGLSFQFRSVSLACAAAMPQLLTTAEISLLKEEKYKLDNKGTPKASADFQRLLPNIFFSMRCYAKVHGVIFEPDTKNHGYESMQKFVSIRNGLEHPKSASGLENSDEDLRHAMEAVIWWKNEVFRLLQACDEADEYWKGRLA